MFASRSHDTPRRPGKALSWGVIGPFFALSLNLSAAPPPPAATVLVSPLRHRPLAQQLLQQTRTLAHQGIPYRYGGTNAKGMDCSASVQHLFRSLGISLPRTSESQANHLAQAARLWRVAPGETEASIFSRLRPGDLLFWVNESKPHKIGHVMVFISKEADGACRLWGARGTGKTGLTGSGVDYFNYRAGTRKKSRLVAYGRPPLE